LVTKELRLNIEVNGTKNPQTSYFNDALALPYGGALQALAGLSLLNF